MASRGVPLLALLALAAGCGGRDTEPDLPSQPMGFEGLVVPEPAQTPSHRLLVIALEGLGPSLCEAARGATLQRLVARGCRALDLGAGGPAGSAGAWTTLLTGVPPSEHGVFADSRVHFDPPDPGNAGRAWGFPPRRAPLVWEALSGDGYEVVTLGLPGEAPPARLGRGAQLVGPLLPGPRSAEATGLWLGEGAPVPGLLAPRLSASEGGVSFVWEPAEGAGEALSGAVRAGVLSLRGYEVDLPVGAWSEPLAFDLALPDGRRVRARTRAFAASLHPLAVYVQPPSAQAISPWLPLSHPAMAALELEQAGFPLRSADWGPDVAAARAGRVPEAALTQALLGEAKARLRAAGEAQRRWDPALLVVALPELAWLAERPEGALGALASLDEELGALVELHSGEVVLVSIGGREDARPVDASPLLGPDLRIAGCAVRLDRSLPPARARARLGSLEQQAAALSGVGAVARPRAQPGPMSGLGPDLWMAPGAGRSCPGESQALGPGVVLGDLEGSGEADLRWGAWLGSHPR